jgi:alkanesulfonate monooxygenase SsuD/methylene tetrahydromethanopterin reductase-like flavin-dependent oxidoreductase (luciferase family)
MPLGAFISTGRTLDQAVERVRLAESLGYDAAYVTHIAGRDSLTVCTAYALATERIRVGTGVIPIYTRTPASMAQVAATIADLSQGRLVLGLGVGHRITVENWWSNSIDKPAAEMKEYVRIVRAILDGDEPPAGSKWQTAFRLGGLGPFPETPIYGSALSPGMLRAVGETCDGVTLWLCNPDYIRDVVIPECATGRERAGKTMDGFAIVAAVPSALTDDRAAAFATMRADLLTYFSLPFYRAMIERSGFEDDIAAFDAAAASGDGEAMQAAISDGFLESLTAVGDEATVRAGVQRYLVAGCPSPCVGPIPRTDFESTLRAAAPR